MPEPKTIQMALTLYQETLRQPSLTALCLDFSGSMQGDGESQLRHAIEFLLTPERASEVLIQWSKRDHIAVIAFNGFVINAWEGSGEAASQAELLANVQRVPADGGTDMYACVQKASEMLRPLLAKNDSLPATAVLVGTWRVSGWIFGFCVFACTAKII